jgi:hypothetical protein
MIKPNEIPIVAFCFAVLIALLIRHRFIKKRSERKEREKQVAERLLWEENRKVALHNEELIKSLNPTLTAPEEIDRYIRLNRHNFPSEEIWDGLLPNMIKDLLAIGWTINEKIYTKDSFGTYQMHISSDNEQRRLNAYSVFARYLWLYDCLLDNPNYIATNRSLLVTETEVNVIKPKDSQNFLLIELDIYEDLDFDRYSIIQCLEVIRQKLPEIMGVNELEIETFITTDSNFLEQEYPLIGMKFKGDIEKFSSDEIEDKIFEWMEKNGNAKQLLAESVFN